MQEGAGVGGRDCVSFIWGHGMWGCLRTPRRTVWEDQGMCLSLGAGGAGVVWEPGAPL